MSPAQTHHFVTLESVGKTHYIAAGEGQPLVLLHGLGASVVAWRRNIPALTERYAVYAPDLPGHGESAKPDIKYSLETGTRFTLEFITALRLERVVLVGNSLGGLLALATALRNPDRVQALVLVDAAGLGRELAWPLRLATLPGIGSILAAADVRSGTRFMRRVFHRPERIEPDVYEELLRVRKLPGVRRAVLRALREGVTLLGLRSSRVLHRHLVSLPVPTLVVWGQEDRILPAEHARRIARQAPNVCVRILPDCGHWPQMEMDREFNQTVMGFLENTAVGEKGTKSL
ncbi:MAG: alpha/beta fold hydrolase [Dehalococcoidia bacterium]